jgi:hypothetical protein
MKKLLILIVLISQYTFADSPLTSTEFYKAYSDVPLVQDAMKCKGKMTNAMLEYIYAETNPLEIKLALINAIGWDVKGLKNSQTFFKYVIKKKNYKTDFGGDYTAFKWYATRDELICYSYLKAMENYFELADAFDIASEAQRKYPESFAVNMIYNLIKSQGLTAFGESCYASKTFSSLKNNPKLTMDMKKESMPFVFEYMDYIGKDCKTQ